MRMNIPSKSLTASVLACSLLAGCASVPPRNPELARAHSDYNAANANSAVRQAAPAQLQKASSDLSRADQLLKSGAPTFKVDHYAYLARQRVAIAREEAANNAAEKKISEAGRRRAKMLLEEKNGRIAKLNAELSKLKAKKTSRGLVLTLGNVLFALNKATLKPGDMKSVDNLAMFMKSYPKRNVMIEGYTDSTGPAQFNKKLSRERAESVRNALVKDGISPERITIKGYGAEYPVASNKTAAGRQQNRRVEVVISGPNGNFLKSR